MIIDIIPAWLLFIVVIGVVLVTYEIGFRIGRTIRVRGKAERESPASAISNTTLGLLAVMLAFTFNIVSDRYDAKKLLVREEGRAIRTAWYRADFLPEPDRARSKVLLREYIEQRVGLAEKADAELVEKSQARVLAIQRELWQLAYVNAKAEVNWDLSALYVESLNEISALHTRRVSIGMQDRIPTAIWAVLMSLLVLGMLSVGYYTAIADSRRSRVASILAVAFSLVIALIATLDYPGGRFMPISQQSLITVQTEMEMSK